MKGVVTSFDEHVGLGEIRSDGGSTYPFHCTQIADGTRSIEIGEVVTFRVESNRPKGPEAYEINAEPGVK